MPLISSFLLRRFNFRGYLSIQTVCLQVICCLVYLDFSFHLESSAEPALILLHNQTNAFAFLMADAFDAFLCVFICLFFFGRVYIDSC